MKGLNLLFKDKLTIIIAALLIVTLIVCIPFVPMSAKYTTTSESEFNFKLASGVPVLRLGVNDKDTLTRLTFRQALGEIFMKCYPNAGYENWGTPLDEIHYINFVKEENLPEDRGDKIASGNNTVTESGVVDVYWNADTRTVTVSSAGTIYANPICQELFKGNDEKNQNTGIVDYGISNLRKVGFDNLVTTQVTTISDMFEDCTYLEGFDFDDIETSNVVYMSGVFNDCDNIKNVGGQDCNIDISNLKVGKVDTFATIFGNCDNLESVDLSVLTEKTASLTNIANMFDGCTKLTTVVFGSNFSTEKVKDWRCMFRNCSSIGEINWGANVRVGANANFLESMFSGCTKLTNPNLSDLIKDTSKVTQFGSMFQSCKSLTELDLSKFDTSSATYLQQMFNECTSLQTIKFGNNFTASAATNTSKMFRECQSLGTLDLSTFDFSKVTTYTQMFYFEKDTYSLTVIKPTDQTKWKLEFEAVAVIGKGNVTFQTVQ